MQGHVEGLLQVRVADHGPPEHPRHEDQVPRAGDRRELRRPLHEAEDDRLQDAHTVLPSGKVRLMLAVGRHRNGEGRAGDEIVGTSNGDGERGERRREREALRVRGGDEQDQPDPALTIGRWRLRRRRHRPPGRRRAPRSLRPPPPCGRRLPRRWRSRRPGHRAAHRPRRRPVPRPPACRRATTEAVGPDRAPARRSCVTISPAAMSATAILSRGASQVADRTRAVRTGTAASPSRGRSR